MKEILERLFEKFNQEKKLLEEIPLTERWANGNPKLRSDQYDEIIKKFLKANNQIFVLTKKLINELYPDFEILKLALIVSFSKYTEKTFDQMLLDRHGISCEKLSYEWLDYGDYSMKNNEYNLYYYDNCVSHFAERSGEVIKLLCQLERFDDIKEFSELSGKIEIKDDKSYQLSIRYLCSTTLFNKVLPVNNLSNSQHGR